MTSENGFGTIAANIASLAVRALGYFLYGVALVIYVHDKRAIAVFVAMVAALVALAIWVF